MALEGAGSRNGSELLIGSCALVLACSRPAPSAGVAEASGELSIDPSVRTESPLHDAAPSEPPRWAMAPPPSSGECRRTALIALESSPMLRPFLRALRDHFGTGAGPFAMQRVDLAGGRMGIFVSRSNDADPIVLVVDRDQLVWSRPRPIGGITPPFAKLALAPRPDGGIALFGYVVTLHIVAARMWADTGDPYADIELATVDACDALSAAYGSGFGWVVACASRSGTRVQRLREDGATAWDPDGSLVGLSSEVGPAAIAFDAPDTWMMLQRARGVGGDRLLAWRFDARAQPVWSAPANVGALPAKIRSATEERFEVSTGNGVVRVELSRGLAGKDAKAADVAPDGGVHWVTR